MPRLKLLFKAFTKQLGFQKIDITDLWDVKIRLDESRLGAELTGKTILVTGAGGSIGLKSVAVSRFNLNASSCSGMGKLNLPCVS